MNQITEQLSAYLGVPCTFFPPAKDDKAILDAYFAAKERGSREGFVPMLIEAGEGSAETLVEQLYFNVDSGWKGGKLEREAVEAHRREVLAQPLKNGRELLAGMQKQWAEEAAEDGYQWPDEDTLGDFSEESGEGTDSFSGIWGYGRPRMTVPVILAEIPVQNPWEVFAYLPFGGWNECPDTPELMAAAKYWYEEYSAVPAVMTHDVLEFSVPRPVSRERAKELAMEQYAFAPDIVDQGCERVSVLANILACSTVWFFWWD